jgi:integrase
MSKGAESLEFPEASGIRIREKINTSGKDSYKTSYAVTVPVKVTGGARLRKQFKSLDAAKKFAKEQRDGKEVQGKVFFSATDRERNEFADLLPKLRDAGVTLREAVEFALPRLRPAGGDKTLSGVIEELRASKLAMLEKGTLREHSERAFRIRSEKVRVEFGDVLVRDLILDEVKSWLSCMELAPRTIKNHLNCLAEIINYSTARKYAAENILDGLTTNDRKELYGEVEAKEPGILTPNEADRLITAALDNPDLDMLAAVSFGLFCGIRTEELKRLDWKDVRFDEGFVTISGKIAKKRSIRNVTISDNAALWISLCAKQEGPVTRSEFFNDYDHRFRKLLSKAGFTKKVKVNEKEKEVIEWKKNAMRHSFGTYHFALHEDSIKTSNQLGHRQGDHVLFEHYRALATKKQAENYFGIVPPANANKVVDFAT